MKRDQNRKILVSIILLLIVAIIILNLGDFMEGFKDGFYGR